MQGWKTPASMIFLIHPTGESDLPGFSFVETSSRSDASLRLGGTQWK